MWEIQFRSLGWEYPGKREWLSIPIFLPREFHGQGSQARYSPCGHKDMTVGYDWMTNTFRFYYSPFFCVSSKLSSVYIFKNMYVSMFMRMLSCSVTQLCLTLWDPRTVACQAPLTMGFPRQEYWSGLPTPSLGDLTDPGMEPVSPTLAGEFFTIWEAPSIYSLYENTFNLPKIFTKSKIIDYNNLWLIL